jgi:amidase
MGLPGISVPTGMVGSTPMGVQLVSARFREDLLLDAAEAIEQAAGFVADLVELPWHSHTSPGKEASP